MLVGQARCLRFGTFARALAYWSQRADPAGAEERAGARRPEPLFSVFVGFETLAGMQLRDRECFHQYRDVVAELCEIDHVQPWPEGGPTTQANGRVACGFHNRQRQRAP